MSVHVAIVTGEYAGLILSGRKTIECRLTRTAIPPFGVVTPGERIYLKKSAGPFFAVAEAAAVWMADRLTQEVVEGLRKRYDKGICGTEAYWSGKRDARFATLIWLRDVRACEMRPRYRPQNMRAWYTLEDSADPMAGGSAGETAGESTAVGGVAGGSRIARVAIGGVGSSFEVKLTAGNLRQGYVRLGEMMERLPVWAIGGRTKGEQGRPIVLRLTGGRRVETDIVGPRRMVRWRGWAEWFESHGVEAGDRLRFEAAGEGEYRVRVVRQG